MASTGVIMASTGVIMPRYIQRSFDPWTMNMDSIRDILILHKIKPPTGLVRKSELVALFEQHVRPVTQQLRENWESEHKEDNDIPVKQDSAKKKIKVPTLPHQHQHQHHLHQLASSSSTSTASGLTSTSLTKNDARTLSPVKKATPESTTTAPQKVFSASSPSVDSGPGSSAVKVKRRPAIPDTVQNSLFDVDTVTGSDSDASRGRLSKRLASQNNVEGITSTTSKETRRKKPEDVRTKRKKKIDNFSDENPFQSGSESERRKRSKSRGPSSRSSSATSSSPSRPRRSRRKSPGNEDGNEDQFSEMDRFFNTPRDHSPAFTKHMRTPKYTTPYIAQEDLEKRHFQSSPLLAKTKRMAMENLSLPRLKPLDFDGHRSRNGHSHGYGHGNGSSRKNERPQPSQLGPLWLLLSVCMVSYGLWYCQTRFDVGYCLPNEPPRPTNLTKVEKIMDKLYPGCMPCPDHATCILPKEDPICPPEYLLIPHRFSFNNMLPIPQICVLDKAREYQSLQVADVTEMILRERAGKVECSTYSRHPSTAETLAQKRMSIHDLKRRIESMKDSSINQQDFEQYWQLALQELRKRMATIVEEQGIGEIYLRSLRPARPLACCIQQTVVGWIIQYQAPLIAFMVLSITGLLLRHHILKRREERRIINSLVKTILEKLSEQAHFYYLDPVLYEDLFIPQIHLRDVLLSEIHSPLKRQEIWEKVSLIVDKNANVRVSTQEVRGEMHRVWEWVGASGLLSVASSLNRKRPEEEEEERGKKPLSFSSRLKEATSFRTSLSLESSTGSSRSNKSYLSNSDNNSSSSRSRDSRPKVHNPFLVDTDMETEIVAKKERMSSLYPSLTQQYAELK